MTNEEAIEILQGAIKKPNTKDGYLGQAIDMAIKALEQEPCGDAISRQYLIDIATKDGAYDYVSAQEIANAPSVKPQEPNWIPVSERLPELNKPLLVTAYHRVCYAHMISKSGNYGYPVFRLHEIKDSDRGWVQETISHEPYSKGRIDAWMYIDIPEPYKVEPQESEDKE